MNYGNPFFWFLGILGLGFVGIVWWLRDLIDEITKSATRHARANVGSYVKCGALMLTASIAAFDQAFHPLTTEQATKLAWWDWAILFFKPFAAALAVLIAYLQAPTTGHEPAKPPTNPPFSTTPNP
jgi:hypothetical protein